MSDVTSRTVTRWFYKGKGYARMNDALMAKARDLLKDELYGDRTCFLDERGITVRDDVAKDIATQKLTEKFPHDPGVCDSSFTTSPCFSDGDEFMLPWCRVGRRLWLLAKVRELRLEMTEPAQP